MAQDSDNLLIPRDWLKWPRAPLALLLLVALAIAVLPNLVFAVIAPSQSVVEKHFGDDDAYYYFQIARNIVSGHGSSFDRITRTNGFHPLWMLLLIPVFSLSAIDYVLPLRVVLVISSLLHFGSMAMLLLSLFRVGVNCLAGFSVILLFMLSPRWDAAILAGSEMALNLFCLSLFIYLLISGFEKGSEHVGRSASLLGAVASLLFLARLDNIFLVLILTAYILWFLLARYAKSRRQGIILGVKYSGPIIISASLYALFNQSYYGGIVPVSGQVKMYWTSIGGSVFRSVPSFGNYFEPLCNKAVCGPVGSLRYCLQWGERSHLILAIAGALLVFVLMQRKNTIRTFLFLLFVASILHTSYYAAVGYVQTRSWYWVSEYVTVILFLALGLNGLLAVFRKRWVQLAVSVILVIQLVTLLPPYFSYTLGNFEFRPTDGSDHFERAQFLESSTPENAIIGTPNAGGLAYFTNRRIVNIDGLVNSYEFLKLMKTQQSHLYLKAIGVNYIFIGPGYDEFEPYTHMLTGKLELVGRWTTLDGKRPHDLFQYFPD